MMLLFRIKHLFSDNWIIPVMLFISLLWVGWLSIETLFQPIVKTTLPLVAVGENLVIRSYKQDGTLSKVAKIKELSRQDTNLFAINLIDIMYFNKGQVWQLAANEGILDYKNKNITLRGNVEVISQSGSQHIQTEQLAINLNNYNMLTDAPIRLVWGDSILTASGAYLDTATQRLNIRSNVRLQISNKGKQNGSHRPV